MTIGPLVLRGAGYTPQEHRRQESSPPHGPLSDVSCAGGGNGSQQRSPEKSAMRSINDCLTGEGPLGRLKTFHLDSDWHILGISTAPVTRPSSSNFYEQNEGLTPSRRGMGGADRDMAGKGPRSTTHHGCLQIRRSPSRGFAVLLRLPPPFPSRAGL